MRFKKLISYLFVSNAVMLVGCASSGVDISTCSSLTAPTSQKIYLYMTREHNPSEQILEALSANTSYALLQQDQDVKVVNDLQAVGADGTLLTIDIIGSRRGGVSKRIDIRYELVNNSTKQVLFKGKDAVGSKLGYNKITVKMGKNIARNVVDVFNCVQASEKNKPNVKSASTSGVSPQAPEQEKISVESNGN